jgi:hypothetical protein
MKAIGSVSLRIAFWLLHRLCLCAQRSRLARAKPRRPNSPSLSDTRRNWPSVRAVRQERAIFVSYRRAVSQRQTSARTD